LNIIRRSSAGVLSAPNVFVMLVHHCEDWHRLRLLSVWIEPQQVKSGVAMECDDFQRKTQRSMCDLW